MDFRKIADKLGIDELEFRGVVKLFIETSTADMTELNSAIDKGDVQRVFTASHSIKGASISLGFHDISTTARNIEIKARQNILEGTAEAAAQLKQKLEKVAAQI